MTCHKYQPLIVEYLDEELDSKERHQVQEHLETCNECRELSGNLAQGLKIFKAVGKTETSAELSPYLPQRIAARAMEGKKSPWFRPWAARLSVSFATLVILIGLTGYFLKVYYPGEIITGPGRGASLGAFKYQSKVIGIEIEEGRFVLHSKDGNGKSGVDVKL